MKKLFLIFLISVSNFAGYSWESYGPQNIEAINICFGPYFFNPEMICTKDGMYLFNDNNYEWEYYSVNGLPVQEGIFLDSETIILVTGDGTDSDGIYQFDIPTGQFTVLANCLSPNFIRYDDYGGKYYVGYESGVLVSDDGIIWEGIPLFDGKPCGEMAVQWNHLVILVFILPQNLFWSDDSGTTWNNSSSSAPFTRLTFYGNDLFGVFPSESYSAGLYKSTDFGNTWDVEFWSMNMSDVCYDDYDGELFVSWNNTDTDYEGIAIYEPDSPTSELTFFNDGLPNTNINRIKYRPIIDAFYVFVCTDTGVYSYVFVGIEEKTVDHNISIFPNPVSDEMHINLDLAEPINNNCKIEVVDNLGMKVDEIKVENTSSQEKKITWNKGNLPAGVYFLLVKTKNETLTKKFIIL
jgi:hypothetical protein